MPLPSLWPSKPALTEETLTASTRWLDDVAILMLSGRLDTQNPLVAAQCVERTLGQIDACFDEHPLGVIVDLWATEPTRFVVALLGLVRRRAERSAVPLALAAPAACRDLLEDVQVASLYAIHPSLDSALEAVAAGAATPGRARSSRAGTRGWGTRRPTADRRT